MAERPAVNPNVDDIADRAKHEYAIGTRLLAAVQADSFGAKAMHKLIDAYPDPIAMTDVEDYEEEDR
jgi:hypothetical protein